VTATIVIGDAICISRPGGAIYRDAGGPWSRRRLSEKSHGTLRTLRPEPEYEWGDAVEWVGDRPGPREARRSVDLDAGRGIEGPTTERTTHGPVSRGDIMAQLFSLRNGHGDGAAAWGGSTALGRREAPGDAVIATRGAGVTHGRFRFGPRDGDGRFAIYTPT